MTAWRTDVYGQLDPLGYRPDGLGGLEAVYAPRVSRNGTLLPIPPGSAIAAKIEELTAAWPDAYVLARYPRSHWLGEAEGWLRVAYPAASTADLALTARSLAPFPLAQPGVR